MQPLELYGTISNEGKLTIINRERLLEWCRDCKGKNVLIKLSRRSAKRTLPQNAYYWSVVIGEITIRLRELGHQHLSPETVHEMMKMKFNYEREINEATGEVLDIPKTTTVLNKLEFSEYIENIRQWAAQFLSINIPDPEITV